MTAGFLATTALGAALALAAMQPAAAEDSVSRTAAGAIELPAIDVTGLTIGGGFLGPLPPGFSAALKTPTPLIETPQAIQAIPREVIEERNPQRLKDVATLASGVFTLQGEGARDDFTIRGFPALTDVFKDGVRDDAFQQYRDLANIERIEVLKGPSAALYGRGSAGGLLNLITRKPPSDPARSLTLSGGSFGYKRLEGDFGGRIGDTPFFYRLDGAIEDADSFRDFVDSQRHFIAPSLAYRPSADLEVLGQIEYLHDERTPDRGIPSFQGRPVRVPRSTFLGEPFDYQRADVVNGTVAVTYSPTTDWTLRNVFRVSDADIEQLGTRNGTLAANGRALSRSYNFFSVPQRNYFDQLESTHRFGFLGAEHVVLAGLEYGRQERDFLSKNAAAPSIDIFNPVHTAPRPTFTTAAIDAAFTSDAVGAYLQDQIKFSEEWHLLASARVDRFDQHQLSRLNGQVLQRTDDTFSPRLGLVYRPLPQLSFYGTASRSYQPTGSSFFFSQNLADLRPERTDLIEVGAKTDWFDGRLQGSLALYRVDKANVATNDPARPNVRLAVGEQRHQGVEVDLVAKPLDGWDVRAAYTYIDAEITKSNNFPVGARPANVPRHAAQVWTNYEIGAGFGIGGGLTYVGARYATADDTVRLPGYVRTDARLYYKHPRFEANLSVNNLFNARYFEAASTNSQISPGAPRSIVLSLRVPL